MKRILGTFSALLLLCVLAVPPAGADTSTDMQLLLDDVNTQLEAQGSDLRVGKIEWLTAADGDEVGRTVFFNDRGNKQLDFDWVAFDPRRTWNPSSAEISYVVDLSDGATDDGLTALDTEAAIDRAMTTWDVTTNCSDLPIFKVADPGFDVDLIDGFLGFGGFGTPVADISHAGWVPPGIFGPNVLGVTFTLIFVDGAGNPTDIDGNGLIDVAIREIFYNDAFFWAVDGGNIDVETVALHEAGHGLSQAHFGKLFRTDANGKFHFAPRSVMNAGYTGPNRDLDSTDLAGHCSIWGGWPSH